MPNWCVGTLKVRGEKENLRNFLVGTFTVPASVVDVLTKTEVPQAEVEETEDCLVIKAPKGRNLYVRGSRRDFITDSEIEWYFDETTLLLDYEAAWAVDTEALKRLSEEFQVDIKIYAFEKGMGYNMDFEVHKGEVITCKEVTFKDYQWDCPCPNLGG